PVLRDVDLAADQRLDALARRLTVELHRPRERPVIGEGDRRHLELGRPRRERRDAARTVEDRVLGVDVQMDEASFSHGSTNIAPASASTYARGRSAHLTCERGRDRARPPVDSLSTTPPPARTEGHVLEPRRGMAVLHAQALDQLRSRLERLRELLARTLAQGGRERVNLPDCRFRTRHVAIAADNASHVCNASVPKV